MQDCLHHSSLSLYKSLDLNPPKMVVNVTIGVQKPDQVDTDAVAKQLPYGTVTVTAVKGRLNVPDEANGLLTVVAAAAVEAWYDIPEGAVSVGCVNGFSELISTYKTFQSTCSDVSSAPESCHESDGH